MPNTKKEVNVSKPLLLYNTCNFNRQRRIIFGLVLKKHSLTKTNVDLSSVYILKFVIHLFYFLIG